MYNFRSDNFIIFPLEKLATLFKARIGAIKIHRVLKFSQSQWLKPYVELNIQKRIVSEKNGEKMEKICTS